MSANGNTGAGISTPTWETFTHAGCDFLRTPLPDSPHTGSVFTVARSVAGRYRVERLLACGEATVLLQALDTRTDRPVALKALRCDSYPRGVESVADADALSDAIRRSRHILQTERRLLVRLRNAGCRAVPVPLDYVYDRNVGLETLTTPTDVGGNHAGLDPFLSATEPYLVLPFLPGETLEVAIMHRFPSGMEESQALRKILPVVRALEMLHKPWRLQNGRTWHCIYQDLKPANLMVEPDGSLTLIDLGGCQVVVDGVAVLEGSFTPGYASPEGEGQGPARVLLACADVYTIGSTLFHMLTGRDPRERIGGWRARGVRHDPDALPAGISPGLKRLLSACLAIRPSERIADAGRVATVIEGLLRADTPCAFPPRRGGMS